MGCDIHAHIEVKIEGYWYHYAQIDINRDYNLFSLMGNVRNVNPKEEGYIEPLSDNRGLPEDSTFLTRFDCNRWKTDAHSHSWLSAQELFFVCAWLEKGSFNTVERKIRDTFGYVFGNYINDFIRFPDDTPEGVEDIRLVFWFDN